jgi:hypothetical protein
MKNPTSISTVTLLLLTAAALAGGEVLLLPPPPLVMAAGNSDIHIPTGKSVSTSWSITDSMGFRWDINCNGQVNDGTNDAYDGGMQLRVNGTQFQWSSNGRMGKNSREVEYGPWTTGSLKVSRRIYVDPKEGYCRWIDIFENTSSQQQSLTVQYYSNLGDSVQSVRTSTGGAAVGEKDWAVVTGGASGSSRPALVHVFATRSAKVRPKFTFSNGSDNIYYNVVLKVPARKAVALCLIEAQRRPVSAAHKFMEEFKLSRELQKIPAPLRRIIQNMGGSTLTLENIELPRREEHDLAVLRNGDELLGTISNKQFVIETFYGKLELPAERVIGLNVPTASDPHVQVVLVDGQVVSGAFVNAPLTLTMTNGSEMALPLSKLQTASFKLSPTRPAEIAVKKQAVVLRSGQRLFYRRDDIDYTYHTEYGTVKLNPDDVRAILLDTPEGGLHRVTFCNGSVLSGLLVAEDLKLTLDLGPTLSIRRHLVAQILLSTADTKEADLAEITLRNEDRLRGRIAAEALTLKTKYGEVVAKPAEIATLEFQPTEFGRVQIGLHNGTTVTGTLMGETIRFQIEAGPALPIFIGHIVGLTSSKPAGTATTKPAAKPNTTPPTTAPAKPLPTPPVNIDPHSHPAPPAEAPKPVIDVRRISRVEAARAEKLAVQRAKRADELAARRANLNDQLAHLQQVAHKLTALAKKAPNDSGIAAQLKKVGEQMADVEKELEALAKLAAK